MKYSRSLRAAALLAVALLLPLNFATGFGGGGSEEVQPAGGKFAFILGNAAYEVSPLRNTLNDAKDMAEALKALGFDVTLVLDANQKTMLRRIDEFGARIQGASIALFYYSGHAVQVGKENYLIPVEAEISTANDVEYEGVRLGRVLAKMEDSRSKANLIILDACRDNPFPGATKGGSKGLAIVENKPPESMIVYATGAGQTAADGEGRNSPFTEALLKHIARPEDFYTLLLEVKREVRTVTNNRQVPDNWDNLSGRVYLGSASPTGYGSQPPQASPPTLPQVQTPPKLQPGAKTAEIFVIANRVGAEVFIDGQLLGTAPNLFTGIPAEREILVEARQGLFVARQKATLKTGELREFTFTLEREKGRLYIRIANPTSYTLVLDGEKQGQLSETGLVNGVGAGDREMELIGYGLYWKGKVTVKAGNETTIVTATPWTDEIKAPKDMVFVQGGTFMMGSDSGYSDEKPVHQVTLSSFMIGKFEVTQGLFQKVMGNNPSKYYNDSESPRRPVESVSWYEAVAFCNKLSELAGLQTVYAISGTNVETDFSRNGYRLPTESEWEYAARGGNKSRNYKYSGSNDAGIVAWYDANSGDTTHAVGTKAPNELGLYDMSGNVWEWCWDWYKDSYDAGAQRNPLGASSGDNRVLRGGDKHNRASNLSATNRNQDDPSKRYVNVGFRVVRRP
jgi:formylglycine-generating enzyme required for sulfatase activity